MRKVTYHGLSEKIRDYGVSRFYRDTGIGGKMNFLYQLEEGRPISIKSLDACCDFFECDIWELIEEVCDD